MQIMQIFKSQPKVASTQGNTVNNSRFGNFLRSHPNIAASLGAIGVLSAIGSLLATVGANLERDDSGNRIVAERSVELGSFTLHGAVGLLDADPGEEVGLVPGFKGSIGHTTTKEVVTGAGWVEQGVSSEITDVDKVTSDAMTYSREFEEGINADKPVTLSGIDFAVTTIEDKIADGWRLVDVTVQGTASDEDDSILSDGTVDPDGGLDKPAPTKPGALLNNNEALASVRGETGSKLLQEAVLSRLGIDISKISTVLPGKEITDPELNEEIRALAQNYNVTPLTLMNAYNFNTPLDEGQLTPEERVLAQQLVNDQGALDILGGLDKDRTYIFNMEFEKTVMEKHYVWKEGELVETQVERTITGAEIAVVVIPALLVGLIKTIPPTRPIPTYPKQEPHKRKEHLKGGPTHPGFKRKPFRLEDPGSASQANRGPVTTHRGHKQSTGQSPKRSKPKGRQKR